jgi:Zn-dependent protease with chaperone function
MIRPISLFLIACLTLAEYVTANVLQGAGYWAIILLIIVPAIALSFAPKARTQKFGVEVITIVILLAWSMDLFMFTWLQYVQTVLGDQFLLVQFGALLPALISLTILWWMTSPIKNRVAWISHRLRVDVLLLFIPLFILWGVREVARAYYTHEVAEDTMFFAIIALIIFSPFVIRVILPAKKITDSNLESIVLKVARRAGIREAKVLVWNTHMLLMNAFAIGIIFQPKTIVLTDKLIAFLSQRELLAVVRHEFAHHRYWHLTFLILGMFSTLLWTDFVAKSVGLDTSLGYIQIIQLLCVILVFVLLSRAFEEQADAYAVKDESTSAGSDAVLQEAVLSLSSALGAIAQAGNQSGDRTDVLHGTILQRQIKIEALVGCTLNATPIDKKVKWIQIAIVLSIVARIIL